MWMKLKSTSDENIGIGNAYNQIQTYKHDIPSLFHYNTFNIISDAINTKAGTITSNEEHYMKWRSIGFTNHWYVFRFGIWETTDVFLRMDMATWDIVTWISYQRIRGER
nr:type I restriction endonuclease [Bacillus toyonensis]